VKGARRFPRGTSPRAVLSASEGRFDLTNTTRPRPRSVRLAVDTHVIRGRDGALRHAIAEFDLTAEVVLALCAEVDRLFRLLIEERLRYANLLAAALATFGAARDGEGDPLGYLRDELADATHGLREALGEWPQ
jgi:hypothetical protein